MIKKTQKTLDFEELTRKLEVCSKIINTYSDGEIIFPAKINFLITEIFFTLLTSEGYKKLGSNWEEYIDLLKELKDVLQKLGLDTVKIAEEYYKTLK